MFTKEIGHPRVSKPQNFLPPKIHVMKPSNQRFQTRKLSETGSKLRQFAQNRPIQAIHLVSSRGGLGCISRVKSRISPAPGRRNLHLSSRSGFKLAKLFGRQRRPRKSGILGSQISILQREFDHLGISNSENLLPPKAAEKNAILESSNRRFQTPKHSQTDPKLS